MDYLLNRVSCENLIEKYSKVLNLIINGLPSKLKLRSKVISDLNKGFKPYYKWITF